jgi:hypothetical protein
MTKLKWHRRTGRSTESIKGEGRILSNGAVTPRVPSDDLARRAHAQMKKWLRTLTRNQRESIPRGP